MGRIRREFIHIEQNLFNEDRFFSLSEFGQLLYIKLISYAKANRNKISKNRSIIGRYARTNRSESEIESVINKIKENFPKFKENKYFYYFENFEKRYFRGTPKNGVSQVVDRDRDRDRDRDIQGTQFETVWSEYPSKTGKKSAERHFNASVKTEEDFKQILCAVENYKNSKRVKKGYIMNGSTFFNDWQAWVNPPKHEMEQKSGRREL